MHRLFAREQKGEECPSISQHTRTAIDDHQKMGLRAARGLGRPDEAAQIRRTSCRLAAEEEEEPKSQQSCPRGALPAGTTHAVDSDSVTAKR
ncbi:hypothetical protein HPB47_008590 [Ixodes persulcatus]|uniref:Uncharacterized protein n=1 Tax=Ixodes persulcatus TaxID=34615 RepID=A0AC60P4D7_IXOPE|nr:hypothetical protein HPB47_008590 [Ixodes persulcatus]